MSTVGIQESTLQVNNGLASPVEHQSGILSYNGNRDSFQVLFVGIAKEFFNVFRIYNYCHSFLRLGNSKLGPVQTCIFLRYFIKINSQTVCQLTDCYRYTACTEVVTLLDQLTDFLSAEQSLNLTLGRSITLLYLGTTCLNRALCVHLGRTGSTAAAVTSGTSAQQDDDITGIRSLTDYISSGSSTHNGTDFHSLSHIIGMIDFFYKTGSQTDLITIGGISACRTANQLLLRQLTLQGVSHRNGRVGSTGYTHSLIYIASSGQGITDRTAQTGSRATERLDLGRMVVCLILEEYQPLLGYFLSVIIHFYRYNYGAGIDLIGLFHIGQLAVFFQLSHSHQCQIHQTYELVTSACKDLCSGIQITLVSGLDRRTIISVTELYISQFCRESGMTAVVGPVGIQHTNLGHGRISLLITAEIILDMQEILKGHSQTKGIVQLTQFSLFHITETVKNRHISRIIIYSDQSLRLHQICLPGIYRVDTISFDFRKFFVRDITYQQISNCCLDDRLFILIQELHTLYCRICSLVELTGQKFYGKYSAAFRNLNGFLIQIIYRRFRKYGLTCFGKYFI